MSVRRQRQVEERRLHREYSGELVPLVVNLQVPSELAASVASQIAPFVNRNHPAVPLLLLDGPKQAEDESSPGTLLVGQGGPQPPYIQSAGTQGDRVCLQAVSGEPRRSIPLRKQVEHSDSPSCSVPVVSQEPSFERPAPLAMQESGNRELAIVTCRQGQVYSLDVEQFLNDTMMLRMYFDVWSSSSNGDTPDIRALIEHFNSRPLKELVTVIDAVCTHVPITLGRETMEYVIGLLHYGLDLCQDIKHALAKVLIVRLRRRIACIYFRQGMLQEARREIDEAQGIISCLLRGCVDVGIADTYWLLAWIRLCEVWDDEVELADSYQSILRCTRMAMDIAQKLPNEDLRMAYTGRIACSTACLLLTLASHRRFQDKRAELEKVASELVNYTAYCRLAKRDQSLQCRTKVWLSIVHREHISDDVLQITRECSDVDRSNIVFTRFSVHKQDIERACMNVFD